VKDILSSTETKLQKFRINSRQNNKQYPANKY